MSSDTDGSGCQFSKSRRSVGLPKICGIGKGDKTFLESEGKIECCMCEKKGREG